jgi:hypothetical protein
VQQHQLTPDYTAPNSSNPSVHGRQQSDNSQSQQQQQQQQQRRPSGRAVGEQGKQKQRQWQEEQLQLLQQQQALAQQQMLVCIMDNRGMGRSSCPRDNAAYSTSIMAQDVVAVMVSVVPMCYDCYT